MSEEIRSVLVRFLDELEAIGETHEEVYDTDVRDRLAAHIESAFVDAAGELPTSTDLGMFSAEANERVKSALDRFLAEGRAACASISDPAVRRAAVWDEDARSSSGLSVDEFLGWPG